jgi:hypothetical protein
VATIKQSIVAIGIAGGLAACGSSSMSSAAASIREAEDSDLGDCAFLQKVKGDGDAAASAKRAAREQAAKLGATHIKWIIPCCTSVEADAYRCDVPET